MPALFIEGSQSLKPSALNLFNQTTMKSYNFKLKDNFISQE